MFPLAGYDPLWVLVVRSVLLTGLATNHFSVPFLVKTNIIDLPGAGFFKTGRQKPLKLKQETQAKNSRKKLNLREVLQKLKKKTRFY